MRSLARDSVAAVSQPRCTLGWHSGAGGPHFRKPVLHHISLHD